MKVQTVARPTGDAAFTTGGPEAEARIKRDASTLSRALRLAFPEARALFLVGGYGRGEGGVYARPDGPAPFNDYDLLLVFDRLGPLARRGVRRRVAALTPKLADEVGIPVDVGVRDRVTLLNAPPSILWYEISAAHRLLWGDPEVAFPAFDPAELPLDEAILLLTNRGSSVLLRSYSRGRPGCGRVVTSEDATDAMKLVLAWGDCVLLAARRYTVSYRERLRRLEGLRGDLGPFSEELPRLYRRAVEFKLMPNPEAISTAEVERLHDLHASFLAWFEASRLGSAVESWLSYADPRRRKLALRRPPARMLVKHAALLGPPRDAANLRLHLAPTYERLASVLPLLLFGRAEDWCEATHLLNAARRGRDVWRRAAARYLRVWK